MELSGKLGGVGAKVLINVIYNRKDASLLNKHSYPIPSREEILGILRTTKSQQKIDTIAGALGVKPEELDGMVRRLNAMERDGQLKLDKLGNYTLANHENFISGRVSSHRDGYGFLPPSLKFRTK